MKHVFLSTVTQEYGLSRPDLKAMFAKHGITLHIQEDFSDKASPHGTLLKIYLFMNQADMVVHVIGSRKPAVVTRAEADELYSALPKFRDWLEDMAILPAVEAGQVGYSDFEAYMALFLRTPIVIMKRGSGAQPEHEERLRPLEPANEGRLIRLGRHANGRVQTMDDILHATVFALDAEAQLDRPRQLAEAKMMQHGRLLGETLVVGVSLLSAYVIHLSVTADPIAVCAGTVGAHLQPLASFLVAIVAMTGVHLAAMSQRLRMSFRMRMSIRNGSTWLLLMVSIGWLVSDLASAYWLVLTIGVFLLGMVTRSSTNDLEDEIENWQACNTNQKIRHDGFYWTDRRPVLDALQLADFESMPLEQEIARKGRGTGKRT